MEPSGAWRRPRHYGDALGEYWAVRRAVSVMDVGTLGKFLVAGPDATEFLDRIYPCHVRDLGSGRLRYALLLGDDGYVVDDGIVCSLGNGRWYVTFTSSGASAAEAMLRDRLDCWRLDAHVADLTAAWGAINVAGPQARELLQRLSADRLDNDAFPYLAHRELTVAGTRCRAFRLGFVGELSYELHHPASASVELWDALLEAGRDLDIRPHGLDALRLLRLEKGHIIVGQDTDFDATPAKLNMPWAVRLDKDAVRRQARARARERPADAAQARRGRVPRRRSQGGLAAPRRRARSRAPLVAAWSPVLERGVALGWIDALRRRLPVGGRGRRLRRPGGRARLLRPGRRPASCLMCEPSRRPSSAASRSPTRLTACRSPPRSPFARHPTSCCWSMPPASRISKACSPWTIPVRSCSTSATDSRSGRSAETSATRSSHSSRRCLLRRPEPSRRACLRTCPRSSSPDDDEYLVVALLHGLPPRAGAAGRRRGQGEPWMSGLLRRRTYLRAAAPRRRYDVIVIGGGGHGLATAYYLAARHGITDVAVLRAQLHRRGRDRPEHDRPPRELQDAASPSSSSSRASSSTGSSRASWTTTCSCPAAGCSGWRTPRTRCACSGSGRC